MKTRTAHISVGILLILLITALTMTEVSAQCAMCKAVAEESLEDGYGMAMGLNKGIMLIMFVPYALLAILFFGFFRKRIWGFLKSFSQIHG